MPRHSKVLPSAATNRVPSMRSLAAEFAGSARGASEAQASVASASARPAEIGALTDETAHVQRNAAIKLTIAQSPVAAAPDVDGGHLVNAANHSAYAVAQLHRI